MAYGSPKVTVVYEASKKPPLIQVSMTPFTARRVLQGHEDIIKTMCADIEKAMNFIHKKDD